MLPVGGGGTTAAHPTPTEKVGNSHLAVLILSWASLRITSIFSIAGEHRIAQQSKGRAPNRPHPELDQGPADLQSIALACQPAVEP